MTDWYRNIDWSDEIADAFEAKLARARSTSRAQYLSLQGQALIARHPAAAHDLLVRAVALDDDFETARALSFLAQAQLAAGNVEAALDTYERGLKRQLAQPRFIAIQPGDYLFLVGYFGRAERLPVAEPIADALPDEGIFGPDPQVLAAKALVFALAGREHEARIAAQQARKLIAGVADAAAFGIEVAELRRRIERLAG